MNKRQIVSFLGKLSFKTEQSGRTSTAGTYSPTATAKADDASGSLETKCLSPYTLSTRDVVGQNLA